ncbi:MAG: N-6 DNA methylase [Planctomycetia bacterium]|nr:N-6 DNA methylase [Planctomycetia bacterium]
MPASGTIKNLVLKFKRNIAQYKSPSYNETETRIEFLNPFWKELGWDVDNEAGYALHYRDVVHEDSIRLKGVGVRRANSKSPDYAFRIGGERKFFLEAKKPSVAIKTDFSPAYQLRCYGWSCGLALSVLSDFEEFAVYDCRIRPKSTDRADTARIKYLTYEDYVDRWDEIAEIFHRESILQGSFDRFIASRKSKTGTSEVDEEFLREIEQWRLILAKDIARNNLDLDARNLNFVVQRTIDRILFLRMAEDRGIEPEDQLFSLLSAPDVYLRLQAIYQKADDKYNSGFFHFSDEDDQTEAPDTLTPTLNISDRTFAEIFRRIYPPVSPYRFDVLPVEILGNVYERFLGKVIRLTPARQVKVEEKPEVKKSNGVFYTPSYIVDYIVKNTVGTLCAGKTPREVSALKILDPACGSGSFLLGAYQFLLNWHLEYYLAEKTKTGKIPQSPPSPGQRKKKSDPNALAQTSTGEWKLTLSERKRILLNNIYGVDIDAQAVEVTKLSLSLCVLEGFNDETIQSNLRLFYDRALPNLSRNILCGNSLIAPDFYDTDQSTLFDLDERLTINAFDWHDPHHGFGKIMKQGGFDAVIGNPPYTYMIDEKSQAYFSEHFQFQDYQKDLYLLFLERYQFLLKNAGLLGVIVSNTWLSSLTYIRIRQYLSQQYRWKRILHLPDKVFKNAVVDTHVLIFEKERPQKTDSFVVDIRQEGEIHLLHTLRSGDIPQDGSPINVISNPQKQALYRRIMEQFPPLKSLCQIFNGVKPFEKGKGTPPQTAKTMQEKPFVFEGENPGKNWSPLLRGSLIQRYTMLWNQNYWIQYGPWLAAPRDPAIFEAPEKIVIRQTGDSLIATLIEGGVIARDNLHLILNNSECDIKYFLGLINSRFMNFIYSVMNPEQGEALAQVKKKHVEQLPVRPIDFSNPSDIAMHDKIVRRVEQILTLNRRLQTETFVNSREREMLEREVFSLDQQIDTLVYDLYGLTEEEIRLVEQEL